MKIVLNRTKKLNYTSVLAWCSCKRSEMVRRSFYNKFNLKLTAVPQLKMYGLTMCSFS